ncbi:hypothetical protein [Aquimarina megaterium]|uniref:hypothetical protein n=1 Tax=Aquimarina megaterium TaxID=1443666 RepID=UPI0004713A3C|nr:hypothetical protein [Aquimarina megaterium]
MRTIRTQRFVRSSSSAHTETTIIVNPDPSDEVGLHLSPFVEEVLRGQFATNTTHTVTLKGYHFDPRSKVVLLGEDFRIRQVRFINPTRLDVVITSGSTQGKFPISVNNNGLGSTSPITVIRILDPEWVDLRKTPISTLNIEVTKGITLKQDRNKGLSTIVNTDGNPFDRGIKFKRNTWLRNDELRFSFIFTTTGTSGLSLLGIGGSNIDVNDLDNGIYSGEIQLFYVNGACSQFYGGGKESNWNQNIGKSITFQKGKFYKVEFHRSGINGTRITIIEVRADNFDMQVQFVHQWISNCPANDPVLMPYWSAVGNPEMFLSAFKIG